MRDTLPEALRTLDLERLQRAWDFRGKVAVVTGGSGYIGGGIAMALGACGAAVVVVGYSRMERAEAVVEEITARGGKATACQADVTKYEEAERLAATVIETFGKVDILVNAAGGTHPKAITSPDLPFYALPEEAVAWVFRLNFWGTFFPCQAFGRHMAERGQGCILNIGSMGALRPLTRNGAYSAAKAAVVNFTQWLAVHMAQEYSPNIRVNALVPGFIVTDQNRFLLVDERTGELTPRGRRIVDHTPMGRLGTVEDLIGPALALCSDAFAYVTGVVLCVDGGMSAYGGV